MTLRLVSWGINSTMVFWLMLKVPFTPAEKVAVGLSCPFLYVQPVIARCYVPGRQSCLGWRRFGNGERHIRWCLRAYGVAGEYAIVFGRDGGGAFLGVGVGGMEEASAREASG